jgi:hypothetical protein
MQDYNEVKITELFDMLAQKTAHYMKMLSGGATKMEFDSCRETIIDLQLEIQSRKTGRTNDTGKEVNFTQDHTRIDRPNK